MKSQTVELPKLKRARGGWVMYEAGQDSICQYHQFCAYSGNERGLCAECHSSCHTTDDHGDIPPHWLSACLCNSCGELFSSKTSFDQHRSLNRCRNPEKRGLELIEKADRYGTVWSIWASPGSRPEDL